MKKNIFLLLIIHYSSLIMAQPDYHAKDTCANNAGWLINVRGASITSAYTMLADTSIHDATVIKFSQNIVAQPQGSWLTAMSYGVLADPDVSCASNIFTIQFRVNTIYALQAYAFYSQPPPDADVAQAIKRSLNKAVRKIN